MGELSWKIEIMYGRAKKKKNPRTNSAKNYRRIKLQVENN